MLLFALTTIALGITSTAAAPSPGKQNRCGSSPSAEAVALAEADFTSKKAALKQAANVTSLFASSFPVYWHVVTSGATVEENVSDKQIADSIAVLNQDYAPAGISFTHVSTDRVVEPNWFNGVSPKNGYDLEMKTALRKGGPSAIPLNIFTAAPVLPSSPNRTVLGYATFPWDFSMSPVTDGVVVRYSTLPGGSSTGMNLGKTLTHEVGHWLGLYHVFQGDSCDGEGDLVPDTPPQSQMTDGGCPATKDSCPGGGPGAIHNFMDYSDDTCVTEFTPGQISRMQSVIATYRSA